MLITCTKNWFGETIPEILIRLFFLILTMNLTICLSQDFVVSTFDNATNGGTQLGDMPKCIPPPKGKAI